MFTVTEPLRVKKNVVPATMSDVESLGYFSKSDREVSRGGMS